MKIYIAIFSLLLFVLFYNSCTKDKTQAPPNCSQIDSVNTYTNSVKEIMDINCASAGCHDATTRFSGIQLDTYENTLAAAKNDPSFFCVIDHSCSPVMPYLLPKLADSLITKVEAWRANCFAQ